MQTVFRLGGPWDGLLPLAATIRGVLPAASWKPGDPLLLRKLHDDFGVQYGVAPKRQWSRVLSHVETMLERLAPLAHGVIANAGYAYVDFGLLVYEGDPVTRRFPVTTLKLIADSGFALMVSAYASERPSANEVESDATEIEHSNEFSGTPVGGEGAVGAALWSVGADARRVVAAVDRGDPGRVPVAAWEARIVSSSEEPRSALQPSTVVIEIRPSPDAPMRCRTLPREFLHFLVGRGIDLIVGGRASTDVA